MPDLLALLSNAAASLSAQKAVSATAAANIQNANTPGYARQRAIVSTALPSEQVNGAFIGRGAVLQTVQQVRDRFVEAQLPAAFGNAASSAAEAQALQSFHQFDTGTTGGIGTSLATFYGSLRALAQNAGDVALRSAALGAARSLATAFNRTSQALETSRAGLDDQLSGLAATANAEAQQVAALNGEIQQARASGAEPNDLLDARQRHLDRLAELTGATTVQNADGTLNVVLPSSATFPGGLALVSGGASARLLLDGSAGGHPVLRLQGVDGALSAALPAAAVGGTIGGTLQARDGALASAAQQVDQLAFDVGSALNAVHQAGVGLDGSTGLALFSGLAGGATNAAAAIGVAFTDPRSLAAATDAASLPGDARNAQLLVETERQALSGGLDAGKTFTGIVATFGASTERATTFAAQDKTVQDGLTAMRESASGVSIDEELVTMQQAQRAYEAISKIIQTADEMLQTLMRLR